MDREAKDQYLLVIQAKDMVGQNGGLSGTTSVTVTLTDVNDNPPRFPRSKQAILLNGARCAHFPCPSIKMSLQIFFFHILLKQIICYYYTLPQFCFIRGMILIQKYRVRRILKINKSNHISLLFLSKIHGSSSFTLSEYYTLFSLFTY